MTEYLVENARLRQLSRQYAEERLTVDAYRTARRAIIDALEAGKVERSGTSDSMPVIATDAHEATNVRQPDDAAVFYKTMPPQVPRADAVPSKEESVSVWDDNTQVLALVLVVSLLIALGALAYVFIL
jgi:hypothetical protein